MRTNLLSITAFALMALAGCPSTVSYPCDAIRLELTTDHTVLSSYEARACPGSLSREALVTGNGYKVYLLSQADNEPKVYLGVVSNAPWKLVANQTLMELPPNHSLDKRATHWTRKGLLPDSVLRITARHEISGEETVHEYAIDTVACICRVREMP